MPRKTYRKFKVTSLEKHGVEIGKGAVYKVTLEDGYLTYDWSETFMRDHQIGGLKAGDVIGLRGKEGNKNFQLYGSNLIVVKMISRAFVPFLLTEVAECEEATRLNGSRYYMMTFWEKDGCSRGMIFERDEFVEKGLEGVKVGDRLLFTVNVKGWDKRRKLRFKDMSGLPFDEIKISRVGPGL